VAYLSGHAGVSGTDAVRVAVHGRPVPEERGSYGPSAPFAVSGAGMDGSVFEALKRGLLCMNGC
jgi:hypothetical protein